MAATTTTVTEAATTETTTVDHLLDRFVSRRDAGALRQLLEMVQDSRQVDNVEAAVKRLGPTRLVDAFVSRGHDGDRNEASDHGDQVDQAVADCGANDGQDVDTEIEGDEKSDATVVAVDPSELAESPEVETAAAAGGEAGLVTTTVQQIDQSPSTPSSLPAQPQPQQPQPQPQQPQPQPQQQLQQPPLAEAVTAEEVQFIAECAKHDHLRQALFSDKLIRLLIGRVLKRPDLSQMLGGGPPSELVTQTCRALGNLCYENDDARRTVLRHDGLGALVTLVRAVHEKITAAAAGGSPAGVVVVADTPADAANVVAAANADGRPLDSLPAVDEKLAVVVMGCLFNVADNDDCQKALQDANVLPLLVDSVALLPGDEARGHAVNLLCALSEADDWQRAFLDTMPSLLRQLVATTHSDEVLESLVDVLQNVFGQASEADKLRLLDLGLWSHLRQLVDKRRKSGDDGGRRRRPGQQVVRSAASLMVLMLTDDACMQRMFAAGKGAEYALMRRWLSDESNELRTYGALAMGNFARGDDLCVALVKDGVAAQLIGMLEPRSVAPGAAAGVAAPTTSAQAAAGSTPTSQDVASGREALEHAVLAGLRNLLIPRENKRALVQSGIVERLLGVLPIGSYAVAFKFLGCIRMLVDRQPDMALKLGSNRDLVRSVVTWSHVEVHAGVKSEAMRVLCWMLKNNASDAVRSVIAAENGVHAIADMLRSEHSVMQNEALIALSLLANGNPPDVVRKALGAITTPIADSLADIVIRSNAASMAKSHATSSSTSGASATSTKSRNIDGAGVANEFLENLVTLVINVYLVVRDEPQQALADKMKPPLDELNRRTRHVPLKDKVCKALHVLNGQ